MACIGAAAELEHVGNDLRRPGRCRANACDGIRYLSLVEIGANPFEIQAQFFRYLPVCVQLKRDSPLDVLCCLGDDPERVIDLMGHPCGKAAYRHHFLGLDHQLLDAGPFGDILDTQHRSSDSVYEKRVEHEVIEMALTLLLDEELLHR